MDMRCEDSVNPLVLSFILLLLVSFEKWGVGWGSVVEQLVEVETKLLRLVGG